MTRNSTSSSSTPQELSSSHPQAKTDQRPCSRSAALLLPASGASPPSAFSQRPRPAAFQFVPATSTPLPSPVADPSPRRLLPTPCGPPFARPAGFQPLSLQTGGELASPNSSGGSPPDSGLDTRRRIDFYNCDTRSSAVAPEEGHLPRDDLSEAHLPQENPHLPREENGKSHLSRSVPNLLPLDGADSAEDGDENENYTYLDPHKKLKVSDNTIKLIQKQAVLEYYERQRRIGGAAGSRLSEADSLLPRSASQASLLESTTSQSTSRRTSTSGDTRPPTRQPLEAALGRTASQPSLQQNRFSSHLDIWQDFDKYSSHNGQQLSSASGYRGVTPEPPLPPPPPPPPDEGQVAVGDEPLPPPPPAELTFADDDSPQAAEVDSPLHGHLSAITSVDSSTAAGQRRSSPATVAARGAPGWERFLGGTSSSVSFTSEEARKFRRTKSKPRARMADGPKSLPYVLEQQGLLSPAKSSPSLSIQPPSTSSSSSTPWWKASVDNLRSAQEFFPNRGLELRPNSEEKDNHSHSHSNSDSGLSSLSGRTSCMSPLSVVSSVSTSSSGSSRASLRSASIVSSSTIPLEEEEEEEEDPPRPLMLREANRQIEDDEIERIAGDVIQCFPALHHLKSLFGTSRSRSNHACHYLRDVLDVGIGLQTTALRSTRPAVPGPPLYRPARRPGGQQLTSLVGGSGGEAIHQLLLTRLDSKMTSLKTDQARLKEETRANEANGRELVALLLAGGRSDESTPTASEVERYRTHVEEVDKIHSLLLSLATRLAKADSMLAVSPQPNQEEALVAKRDKLREQLEEAKLLKQSIDKRAHLVATMIQNRLGPRHFAAYQLFLRRKVHLLVEQRLLADRIGTTEEQCTALKSSIF